MGLLIPFMGLFMVCLGMSLVFFVYLCLLWYASLRSATGGGVGGRDQKLKKGLSAEDLQRLPGAKDGGAVAGTECVVCLDDIEAGQPARVLPCCGHAFHLPCADSWLATSPACPICRTDALTPPPPIPPPPLPLLPAPVE